MLIPSSSTSLAGVNPKLKPPEASKTLADLLWGSWNPYLTSSNHLNNLTASLPIIEAIAELPATIPKHLESSPVTIVIAEALVKRLLESSKSNFFVKNERSC